MRHVAAYILASLGGKASPSQNDIEKILSSVGIEADGEKLKIVISELNGKSIDELIAQGREKLMSIPVGGAAAATVAAAPAGGTAAPAEEKKEEKKPAKEESESEDDDMGFGLFD
ncbi:60S acidic ribosomal protein P2 [Anthophora plagiata]